MADTPSSKVTVTYWDPSSLFPLIEPQLRSRLPLRNLHWKSPTRPLRSIASLDIELVPFTGYNPPLPPSAIPTSTAATTTAASNDLPDVRRVRSSETGGSQSRTSMSPARGSTHITPSARRHQIPGLRQTPYLKVFILRCDDNDTYKATSRKQVREWISSHASHTGIPSHGGSGGPTAPGLIGATGTSKDAGAATAHDAFEWLIIHVLLPNTPAAQQPRSGTAATTANKSWIKGSQTLLEKIRADFNGTGKHAHDRVVQLRVPHDHPDLTTLSPPVPPPMPNTATTPDSIAEVEGEWGDLIVKFKSQILLSFDARVSQYEDDVREKDAQRSLPGWNFCTFFVLKEGLARAFESVGLVEDSLAIYDELECGLESVVRDGGVGVGGFEPWTPEIQEWLLTAGKRRKKAINGEEAQIGDDVDCGFSERPLVSSSRKAYREMILGSIISVYDFRTYVFSRQMTLLLRLATSSSMEGAEDLNPLGELCARAILFITSAARVLRRDLWAAWKSLVPSHEAEQSTGLFDQKVTGTVIDAIVLAWEFAVANQILVETQTASLPRFPPSPQKESKEGDDDDDADSKKTNSKPSFPRRTSSLPSTPVDGGFPGPKLAQLAQQQQLQAALKAGLESLASGRGQLLSMVMGVLEKIATKKGWIGEGGWFDIKKNEEAIMEEIDLNGDIPPPTPPKDEPNEDDLRATRGEKGLPSGVFLDKLLCKEADTEGGLCYLYEEAARRAIRHFESAERYKWAMKMRTSLIAVKYHRGDYAGASSSLDEVIAFYGNTGWDVIETTLLVVQAKCQQQLGHKEEYLRVILRLLAKSAQTERLRVEARGGVVGGGVISGVREGQMDVGGYVAEATQLAREITEKIDLDLGVICDKVQVERFPLHLEDRDGYQLDLKLLYLLEEPMKIEKATVRMGDVSGGSKDVILETGEWTLKKGWCHLPLTTHTTVLGSFVPCTIQLTIANLTFTESSLPSHTSSIPVLSANPDLANTPKSKRTYFYPSSESLQVDLQMPREIRLDKPRILELIIKTGRNKIKNGELRIKSATAGLRLMTGDITVEEGVEVKKTLNPGVIAVGEVGANEEVRVGVRFTAENEALDLALKVEVEYTTDKGTFLHLAFPKTPMALSLAVNVHDIFKASALYSKFAITPSHSGLPLRILSTSLQENDSFACSTGSAAMDESDNIVVFERLPGNFIWRITKKRPFLSSRKEEKLGFCVSFRTIREEIAHTVTHLLQQTLRSHHLDSHLPTLLPPLLATIDSFPPSTLELAALSSGLTATHIPFPWTETLASIPPLTADLLSPILHTFLTNTPSSNTTPFFPLPPYHSSSSIPPPTPRTLLIPVDIPTLPLLFSANIALLPPYDTKPILTTGDALPARVHLSVSTEWANPPPAPGTKWRVIWEVVAQGGGEWLVGGVRRGRAVFGPVAGVQEEDVIKEEEEEGEEEGSVKEGSVKEEVEGVWEKSWTITLVPVRSGELILPGVSVLGVEIIDEEHEAPVQPQTGNNKTASLAVPGVGGRKKDDKKEEKEKERVEVVWEVNLVSAAKTVRVCPDVRSTVVAIEGGEN